MRFCNGLWHYQGQSYTALRDALKAVWNCIQAGGQTEAAPSVTSTESGMTEPFSVSILTDYWRKNKMQILNKATVDALFRCEAVMIGADDCVPEHRAIALFGEDAVKHVWCLDYAMPDKLRNLYGVGDFTIGCLTYKGFLAAASYSNIRQLQKESSAE